MSLLHSTHSNGFWHTCSKSPRVLGSMSHSPSLPSSFTSFPAATSPRGHAQPHLRAWQLLLPLPRTLWPTHHDITCFLLAIGICLNYTCLGRTFFDYPTLVVPFLILLFTLVFFPRCFIIYTYYIYMCTKYTKLYL